MPCTLTCKSTLSDKELDLWDRSSQLFILRSLFVNLDNLHQLPGNKLLNSIPPQWLLPYKCDLLGYVLLVREGIAYVNL